MVGAEETGRPMKLDAVRDLAATWHAPDRDAQGRPYYDAHLRPIAEALRPFGAEAEAAGWLHDLLEDHPDSAEEFAAHGLPAAVVDAVVSVTKREGEPYDGLITRSVADPLGRLVKLADNAWNVLSNPALAATDPERAEEMLSLKYLPARERLLEACGWTMESAEVIAIYTTLREHLARLDRGSD